MKLSYKLRKAFRWQTFAHSRVLKLPGRAMSGFGAWRAARRQERSNGRRESPTVDDILKDFDCASLVSIQQRYSNAGERPDVFWTKYLDYRKWFELNIRYANELGLVANPPRAVLDLGCGSGYFLAVCRHLGSQVLGLDMDKDLVLNEMVALFKIERIVWRIFPSERLPDFRRKFDLITAWMVCFNLPMTRPPWTAAEWDFFLKDITGYLQQNGKLILSLNKQLDDGKLYNDEVRAFFETRGALIQGKRLTFTREDLVRTEGLWGAAQLLIPMVDPTTEVAKKGR